MYHCDNDVVDHQQTNLLMEDGTTISFTMCAFTEDCYRYFKAMGTKGEIEADMKSNLIRIREFGKPEEIIDVGTLASDLKGHGGGDSGIVGDFLDPAPQRRPAQRAHHHPGALHREPSDGPGGGGEPPAGGKVHRPGPAAQPGGITQKKDIRAWAWMSFCHAEIYGAAGAFPAGSSPSAGACLNHRSR